MLSPSHTHSQAAGGRSRKSTSSMTFVTRLHSGATLQRSTLPCKATLHPCALSPCVRHKQRLSFGLPCMVQHGMVQWPLTKQRTALHIVLSTSPGSCETSVTASSESLMASSGAVAEHAPNNSAPEALQGMQHCSSCPFWSHHASQYVATRSATRNTMHACTAAPAPPTAQQALPSCLACHHIPDGAVCLHPAAGAERAAWDASVQQLVAGVQNLGPEDAAKALAKAFGWGSQAFWRGTKARAPSCLFGTLNCQYFGSHGHHGVHASSHPCLSPRKIILTLYTDEHT